MTPPATLRPLYLKCAMKRDVMDGKAYNFSIDVAARTGLWVEYGAPLEITHVDDNVGIVADAKIQVTGWPAHDYVSFRLDRRTLVMHAGLRRPPTSQEISDCRVRTPKELQLKELSAVCDYPVFVTSSSGACEVIASVTPQPMVPPNTSILEKSVFSNQVPWTDDDIQRRAKRTELGKDNSIDTPKTKPTPKATASLNRCDGVEATVAIERRCLKPKDTLKDCAECPEMVVVPAGGFMMGSTEVLESPVHKVAIARSFAVGKFEVTFAEWDACVSDGGCNHKPDDEGWGRGKRPVMNVSWEDITNQYLPWLSRKTAKTYRLLTEAEWEYAARAGSPARYSWGDEVGANRANCDGCGDQNANKQPALVGSFPANAFGLHDMHGNVWEWVTDCYNNSYENAPADAKAAWDVAGCWRVLRGGSWYSDPWLLRASNRGGNSPDSRSAVNGFRVARTFEVAAPASAPAPKAPHASRWTPLGNPETYATNYERRERAIHEKFAQTVTVFHIPMSSDRKNGRPISVDEHLEIFRLPTNEPYMVVQVRLDRKTYWLLSRQTITLAAFPALIGLDPERDQPAFQTIRQTLQNEIDRARHILRTDF